MTNNKYNKIVVSVGVLIAMAVGFGLGGSYTNMQQQSKDKAYNDYTAYVIKEEARLQKTDDFTQLPQHYQEEQINKIPKSLHGKQEQLAYMLAYGLSNDYQEFWFTVN